MLEDSAIAYTINSKLVRGLDYYTSTVFEWTTTQLGAQNAVCAGGRYDHLVEQRGGKPSPAIGFAMGMERFIELVSKQNTARQDSKYRQANVIYFINMTESANVGAETIAERLRDDGYRVISRCGGGKLKSQLKRADQSVAEIAFIVGHQDERGDERQDECQSERPADVVLVKHLRKNIDQQKIPVDGLLAWCNDNIL